METENLPGNVEETMQGLAHRKENAELAREAQCDLTAIEQAQARGMARYSEERDLMNQLAGQVEMARSIAKFTDVVGLSKLAYIKENKLYQSLKGKSGVDSEGKEIADVGCWDGFCRWIGTSSSKVNEDLLNLRELGTDAMESLQRVGAGYRDLRRLRKLSPEDQDKAIAEAEATGDKEALIDMIDQLTTKHVKEKESLEKASNKLQRNLDLKSQDIERKDQQILTLEEKVQGLEGRRRLGNADEEADFEHLRRLQFQIQDIAGTLDLIFASERLAESSPEIQIATAHLCEYMERRGTLLFMKARRQCPDTWGVATPHDNEIHDGFEAEAECRERLETSLGIELLS